GLSMPELLTASHIVPWSVDTRNRTNPRNGLCLNAIHDKAFDCGLITVTTDYRVRVASSLKKPSHPGDNMRQLLFLKYEGERIVLPSRFLPDASFLGYHNVHVFQDARKTK
ncbi:MAG: HNH endonuclease, partial [Candidatus Acidiferrum sp.]